MVLIQTKSIQLTINDSFRETINKFQDRNIKKKLGLLKEKTSE